MSAIDVYITNTTHTHKYKPSISLERGCKFDIAINMLKMIVGKKNKKEARHVEERHEMNFVFAHMRVTEDIMI